MFKRWVIYILILIITAFLSVAYLESAPTVFLGIELMLLVCSFVYMLFSVPGIHVQFSVANDTMTVGGKCELRAKIKNRVILPVFYGELVFLVSYKQSDETIVFKLPFSSMPGRTQEMEYSFTAEYSGTMNVRFRCMYIYDFLRLFRLRRGSHMKAVEVSVVPELQKMLVSDKSSRFITPVTTDYAHNETDPAARVQKFYKDRVGDDPSEVFDTRDYRAGDNLSRVNWKLSARTGNLMVKDYSFPIIEKTVVLVDMNVGSQREFHERVHTAVSICFSLLESHISAAFAWYDEKTNVCTAHRFEEDADLFEIIGELVDENVSERLSPNELVESMNLPNQMEQLIYVTSEMSDEEMEAVSSIEQSKRIYVFAVGSEKNESLIISDKLHYYLLPSDGLREALSDILLYVY